MPPDAEGGDRVAIREATPGDFRAVSDLFEEVDRPHREHLPDLFRKAREAPGEESYINELIAKPDAEGFVAEAGTGIVGLLVAKIHSTPDISILVPLDYVVIDTVVVTTGARPGALIESNSTYSSSIMKKQSISTATWATPH